MSLCDRKCCLIDAVNCRSGRLIDKFAGSAGVSNILVQGHAWQDMTWPWLGHGLARQGHGQVAIEAKRHAGRGVHSDFPVSWPGAATVLYH